MTLHKFGGKCRKSILIALAALVIAMLSCAMYVSDYYPADQAAITAFAPGQGISKHQLNDSTIVYAPEDHPIAGFIFYPGGKVEYTSYEPLAAACAAEGILCVLIEMPFNLAVLNVDAAEGIQERYPEIKDWYIGGHSLGGSMAATHLSKYADNYNGLILLGSYSTAELSDTSLNVLSVYGSEDKILNSEKYSECKANLPDDFTELVIDGGCHAYFGMYGPQDGDGTPTISNEVQIKKTALTIKEHIIQSN